MSILGKILGKIFPSAHASQPSSQPAGATATATATAAPPAAAGTTPPVPAMSQVDVEALLTEKAASSGEKLNWRSSIVDLLKLLDIDSSLSARKDLATELGYTGALDGSAEMNLWLHRQVMNRVAANGGKVPADLKD